MPNLLKPDLYDTVVIGSGIGGLSAAALLSKAGQSVLVLEANYLPGGCCSSYYHKGYVFETGATTLVGLDPGQPLALLQERLGLCFDWQELNPAMAVHIDGQTVTRYKDREAWVAESIRVFGQAEAQRKFWHKVFELSDFVWRVSGRNLRFPPRSLADLLSLARVNHPADYPKLRYAFWSTASVLRGLGLAKNRPFVRFLDEQLLITAQSGTADTPFLFAAPALSYTNTSNYYIAGGMIGLAEQLVAYIGRNGGDVRLGAPVTRLQQTADHLWLVQTDRLGAVRTRNVVSNLPLWNLPGLATDDQPKRFLQQKSDALKDYWGAFTMSLAIRDTLPNGLPLHHQIILPEGESLPETGSLSVFVSLSDPSDRRRTPEGIRAVAISTHATKPSSWFGLAKADYRARKQLVRDAIISQLTETLPGFDPKGIVYELTSSPYTWQDWILRHEGTVGGIPQSMKRPIYKWQGALTPFLGLYLCGDTVYPGQGIPGVALGGIIAAERVMQREKAKQTL